MASPGTPAITLDDIRAAARRIAGAAVQTPLLRLEVDGPPEVWLKLENLQPIGSFKLRGASNAMLSMPRESLARGVWTASAGNMAQGVAWQARRMGIPCTVVAPDHAPAIKLEAIERLGARIVRIPFEAWFQILATHTYPGIEGRFIHPVSDADVIAGNGTIGLEIAAQFPDVEAVLVPYGGGGLSSGIATALRALVPGARVYACEVETAAPLAASLAAKKPVRVSYQPSFVDGIGSPFVLDEMWPLASRLLDGSLVTTIERVAAAVRLLAGRARVIAEGAGAASVAVALAGQVQAKKIVCVVSGGNLDPQKLAAILEGRIP